MPDEPDEQHHDAETDDATGDGQGHAPRDTADDGTGEQPAIDLPQRFDGSFRLGRFQGGATLLVDEGRLELHLDSSIQAQGGLHTLHHEHQTVRVYAARWQPPTSNTGVLVEDGEQVALFDLAGWSRRRLRAALAAAGFDRDETKSDLRLGQDLVRPTKRWWD